MKLLKNMLICLVLIISIGCDGLIIKNDQKVESYDDELIEQIQNATNKIEVDYIDLPANIISTIESSYSTDTFLSEFSVDGLGYELTYSDVGTQQDLFKKIYFNDEGRKLISKKDYYKKDKDCFELVYPIDFVMPDGTTITVDLSQKVIKITEPEGTSEYYDVKTVYGDLIVSSNIKFASGISDNRVLYLSVESRKARVGFIPR